MDQPAPDITNALQQRDQLERDYAKTVLSVSEEYGRQIIGNKRRIDILATKLLRYRLEDFHKQMLQFQNDNKKCLILAPRGSGKSTILTVVRSIFELLVDNNLRILIVSNTQLQAEVFLREIKNHFESNEKFIEAFGKLKGEKWDNKEIDIITKQSFAKESNISCVGVGGAVVGRHYDFIIADDIVDEENSRTELQRERLRTWFYKVLDPTLVADGKICIVGTRYYPNDLYGHILKSDPEFKYIVLPAILPSGNSLWPDEMPIDWLDNKKKAMGLAIFNTQYMNDVEAMEGKIFKYEDCQFYDTLPEQLRIFQGVDLAISQQSTSDYFVIVTIGKDQYNNVFVIDVFQSRLSFLQQTNMIARKFRQYQPIRVFIESNAYQAAQTQIVQAATEVRALPIINTKDKVTRAWHLAHKFESGQVFFPRWGCQDLIDQLISFPDVDHDDMFDAFEIAVNGAGKRIRKQRKEFGVI